MQKSNLKSGNTQKIIKFSVLLLIIIFISACTTSSFLGIGDPLTTSSYVDNASEESALRISNAEEEILRIAEEIAEMKSDLDAVSNIKADLDEMPREMLRQLVAALQSYLEMLENE